jgi:hypothetical protein
MRRAQLKTKSSVILVAVLACGLTVSSAHAAAAKKLTTQSEIEGIEFLGMTGFKFIGDVHSKKNKCERGREVTIRNADPPPGEDETVGTVRTDGTGDFELIVTSGLSPGPFFADVARKRITKGAGKIVCKKTTSDPFVIESM